MLATNIQIQSDSINDYYPNELLVKGPSLIINNRIHQNTQNSKSYEQMRNNHRNTDKNKYPRSIDIESELLRINYYNDKCYYDNYKFNKINDTITDNILSYENHQDTAWNILQPQSTTQNIINQIQNI